MLVKNKSVKTFYNYKCMQPNLYQIFWNFECLIKKLTLKEKIKLISTERLQMHKLSGYCYVVVCMNSSLNYEIMNYNLYKGLDVLERFITKIEEKFLAIQEDLSAPAEIIMISGDLETFREIKKC